MEQMKKSVCVFSHYFSGNYFPLYVRLFLEELQRHFDEIVLVTNLREISNEEAIRSPKVSILKVKNEGYDMGMFYKGFQTLHPVEYETIAFVNDSNILFGKLNFLFDWAKTQNVSFWGLMDSHARPPFSVHANNYHLQSHFIVFNRSSLPFLQEYLNKINLDEFRNEPNIKKLREKVINVWEIGLSQFLLSKELTSAAFVDSSEYQTKYVKNTDVNVSLKLHDKIIENGVPVIKKKVVFSVKIPDLFSYKRNWKRLIKTYGEQKWPLTELVNELSQLKKDTLKQKLNKRTRLSKTS